MWCKGGLYGEKVVLTQTVNEEFYGEKVVFNFQELRIYGIFLVIMILGLW